MTKKKWPTRKDLPAEEIEIDEFGYHKPKKDPWIEE